MTLVPGTMSRTVITLVPGTWASQAWTKKSFPLRKNLLGELEGRVEVETFLWSHANSQVARRDAAVDLWMFLKCQRERHRGKRQILVAHSHGGNVALRCLASQRRRDRRNVAGLVLLATPFLKIEDRDLSGWLLSVPLLVVRFMLALVLLLMGLIFGTLIALALSADQAWAIPLGVIVGTVLVFSGDWAVRSLERAGKRQVKSLQTRLRHLNRFHWPSGLRTLVVEAEGDEARRALKAAHWLTALAERVALLVALMVILAGFLVFEAENSLSAVSLVLLVMLGMAGLFFVRLVLRLLTAPFAGAALGFSLLGLMLLKTRVLSGKELITDKWQDDDQEKPAYEDPTVRGWLIHSALHRDRGTANRIGDWVRGLITQGRKRGDRTTRKRNEPTRANCPKRTRKLPSPRRRTSR
jgi:pimeloyl-ACP methyl ester carboxylesterase